MNLQAELELCHSFNTAYLGAVRKKQKRYFAHLFPKLFYAPPFALLFLNLTPLAQT